MITNKKNKQCAYSVIEANELSALDVHEVCANNAHAIWIKNYYPKHIAEIVSTKLLKNNLSHYINAPTIGRIGMAYFETAGKSVLLDKYYGNAINNINNIREIFNPYYSPLDKFRLQLQEQWLPGAEIENIDGKRMAVGLCRAVEEGIDFLPHQDILKRDAKSNLKARGLKNQLSVNIYLKMADSGGELEMWDKTMPENEYDRLRKGNFGLPRQALSKPDIIIKPQVGDLVLFNAQKFHAVKPSIGGSRISISCFVGYRDVDKPLTLWS